MKTYRDLSSILLYIGNADGSISLNDHDPSAISIAHARAPTVILGEEGFGVAHEQHFGILLGAIDLHAQETKRGFFLSAQFGRVEEMMMHYPSYLSPSTHDPRIIRCNNHYQIHALALQLLDLLEIWRQMTKKVASVHVVNSCRLALHLVAMR